MAKEKRKYADRAEYMKKAVDKRRKKIRQMALEYKGAQCEICGYKKCIKSLEFHHINSDGIKILGYLQKDIPEVGKK